MSFANPPDYQIKKAGFTLIEIVIVIVILGVLITATMIAVTPSLNKSRDGRRKTDLHKIQSALEEYRSDNGTYPERSQLSTCGDNNAALSSYLKVVPCEPNSTTPYYYLPEPNSPACDGTLANPCVRYRLMTRLAVETDPDIEKLGCTTTFMPSGKKGCYRDDTTLKVYNYGVSMGRQVQ